MDILTHRGLDPDIPGFFAESSYEAFESHLSRGFGIEFDVRPTRDGVFVVTHDPTLERLTEGGTAASIAAVDWADILDLSLPRGGRLTRLEEVFDLIAPSSARRSALHLKAAVQTPALLGRLCDLLAARPSTLEKIIIFDLFADSARTILQRLPDAMCAASLSHPFDIARYNKVVGGTLHDVAAIVGLRDIFPWVWLDEWDTQAPSGTKKFYTRELFSGLRACGFKIAAVTPELHGTSPGLLGGNRHADGSDRERLLARINEILTLQPDAVCTDHPDAVCALCTANSRPL